MTRSRPGRGLVLWTLLMLLLAAALAAQAAWSLIGAQQACFFNYPAVPCPGGDDPAVARLTFAFFGAPLIWLAGLTINAVWRVLARRRWHEP